MLLPVKNWSAAPNTLELVLVMGAVPSNAILRTALLSFFIFVIFSFLAFLSSEKVVLFLPTLRPHKHWHAEHYNYEANCTLRRSSNNVNIYNQKQTIIAEQASNKQINWKKPPPFSIENGPLKKTHSNFSFSPVIWKVSLGSFTCKRGLGSFCKEPLRLR